MLSIFENRVLSTPKTDEVTWEWRRPHNEEFYATYSSLNIIRVTKSRKIRRAGHVARRGKRRDAYKVLEGKPDRRNHFEEPDVDGKIILK
jgi:hypothetical protein